MKRIAMAVALLLSGCAHSEPPLADADFQPRLKSYMHCLDVAIKKYSTESGRGSASDVASAAEAACMQFHEAYVDAYRLSVYNGPRDKATAYERADRVLVKQRGEVHEMLISRVAAIRASAH